MWQDELVTLDVALRTPAQLLALIGEVDAVHGAYYLFMHAWVSGFGDSTTALRLPSVLAMTGGCACVALIGERLFGRSAGLLAGFVFASTPTVLRFAQEARSYALVVMLAALSTLLLLRALDRPGPARWAGYGICLTGIVTLNAVAMTIVAGQAIVAARHSRRSRSWRPISGQLTAVALALLPAIPIIMLGRAQVTRQLGWIVHAEPWPVWTQTTGSSRMAVVLLVLASLAWLGDRSGATVATVVAVTPMLAVWLASSGEVNYFFSKYLLFTLPAWAILAGGGLAALRPRLLGAAGMALLAVLVLPAQTALRAPLAHSWYQFPLPRVEPARDYSQAARIIAEGHQAGDAVAFGRAQWWHMHDVGVKHYLPDHLALRDVFEWRSAAQSGDLRATECPMSTECLGAAPRIWIVLSHQYSDPLQMLTSGQADALRQHYRVVTVQHPAGLTVALLERTS
jgi:mannosyltransferase